MNLPVAILAGGLARRLGTIAASMPKALVEVAGKPFLLHQLELLKRQGFTDVVLLVGHFGEMVQQELGDGSRFGIRLSYSFDGARQLGTGGAVRNALPLLGDAFLILNGDTFLECDYVEVQQAFLASGKTALMTVLRNRSSFEKSNVLFVDGVIRRYDKQATDGMHHIDAGLGVLRATAFSDRWAGSFDLASVYQELLRAGQLTAYELSERYYEIGSPAALAETQAYLSTLGFDRLQN